MLMSAVRPALAPQQTQLRAAVTHGKCAAGMHASALGRIRTQSQSLDADMDQEGSTSASDVSAGAPQPRSPLRQIAQATAHAGELTSWRDLVSDQSCPCCYPVCMCWCTGTHTPLLLLLHLDW